MDEKFSKKYFLLKIGVIFLTVLILALWIFNLRNIWSAEREEATPDENQEWQELKVSLDKTLIDIKGQLDSLQNNKEIEKRNADQVLLSDVLKETEKRAAVLASSTTAASVATSSGAVATTTAPEKNKITNCPEYIDCMPTIGAARPCEIPAGCEGITQIAY